MLGKHSANLLPSSASRLLFERRFVLISHSSDGERFQAGDQCRDWGLSNPTLGHS